MIKKIPELTVMLPPINKDKEDFNWFNERFGKSIASEITACIYFMATQQKKHSYYIFNSYVEIIDVSNSQTILTEKIVHNDCSK